MYVVSEVFFVNDDDKKLATLILNVDESYSDKSLVEYDLGDFKYFANRSGWNYCGIYEVQEAATNGDL